MASTKTSPVPPLAARAPARGELLRFAAVSAAAVGAVGVLAAVDPNEPGHYPTCPFLAATGHWCPGCGSLRAVHALTAGDPVTALDRNPLAVLLVPVLALLWLGWFARIRGRGSRWHPTLVPPYVLWLFFTGVVAYGVLRNLPGFHWLSPA